MHDFLPRFFVKHLPLVSITSIPKESALPQKNSLTTKRIRKKKKKIRMKLKFFLPLVIVLLGFYAAETESFGFGLAARLAIRFVQRLIRLAAELARRGRPASYQQLGSSTRALVRYAPPGARQVIKKSLAKVKKVVLSPKFQAGVLAAEGVGAIVDAAIAVNPPISYENFTDAELDSEWQVSILIDFFAPLSYPIMKTLRISGV